MSAKQGSSSFIPKLILVLAIVAGGVVFALRAFRPVARVEPIASGEAPDAKPASVTVKVEYQMELQTEVGGRMIDDDFALDVGKLVTKGDVLAKLDGGDLALEIETVQHDLEAAKAKVAAGSAVALELEGAKSDLETQERLFKLGQISALDYKKAQRVVTGTEQKLEQEKVTNRQTIENLGTLLKQKQRQLSKMTIIAPFNGIVSSVNAHPGQQVGNNFAVAEMITQHKIVEAKISEEDFAEIRVGESASVILLPYGDYVFNGKVSKILPVPDPETQRHLVYIELGDIPPEKLVPGITGDATIVINEHKAEAVVPRRAMFGDSMFVVRNGRVEQVRARKGAVWLTGIEVLPMEKGEPNPIRPDDLVIVEDLDKFRDGDRVSVIEQPSDAFPKKR